MQALLEAEQLWMRRGGAPVLRGVSLRLDPGEVVGLLGINGAGKSTLLACLAGAFVPEAGAIRTPGAVRGHGCAHRVGFLPDPPPLFPELTVGEQLLYAGRLAGLGGAALRRRIHALLEQCDLEREATRRTAALSRGARQRVGLAQALLPEPEVLLLDEPTTGLDPAQMRALRTILGAHRARGDRPGAVLLSTHVLTEASALCDRVCILHEGRIVYSGVSAAGEAAPGVGAGEPHSGATVLRVRLRPGSGIAGETGAHRDPGPAPPDPGPSTPANRAEDPLWSADARSDGEGARGDPDPGNGDRDIEHRLRALPGVASVRSRGPACWDLATRDRPLTTQALMHTTLARGWQLLELGPAPSPLEEIFLALTAGRQAPEGPPSGRPSAPGEVRCAC